MRNGSSEPPYRVNSILIAPLTTPYASLTIGMNVRMPVRKRRPRLVHVTMWTEQVCTLEEVDVVEDPKSFALSRNLAAVQDVATVRDILQSVEVMGRDDHRT